MLYARMDDISHLPSEWDKVQSMFWYLRRIDSYPNRYQPIRGYIGTYKLIFERRMFTTQYGSEYRCSLIKWHGLPPVVREVLLETCEPAQAEAVLLMLISIAKEEGGKKEC